MTTTETTPSTTADEFAERLLGDVLATFETMSIYLGDRLGWYAHLAENGPLTAGELADRSDTHERYAREWLEQQAVCGILTVDADHRFALPPGAAEVLTDPSSLAFLGPLPRMLMAAAEQLPALLAAYRTGGGVSWDELGSDARESQAALNRPWFERALAPALAGVPALHDRLGRPGAVIADVGCGFGWSTLALGRAYPQARVAGFDVDAPSVDAARTHAAAAGLATSVEFTLAEGAVLSEHGPFDVVFAFECIHDMPRPVEVLAAARASLATGGCVIVVDEAVADEFSAPGDDLERFMYGCSVFVCLPDGLSSQPSVGTGTVMRRSTLTRYAEQAGFSAVEVLPIDGFGFLRFYQLTT